MNLNDREPMNDDDLSVLLEKWTVPSAPASLEARVTARQKTRPSSRWLPSKWVLIPAAASMLAAGAIAAAWLMRPAPRLPRFVETVVLPAPAAAETTPEAAQVAIVETPAPAVQNQPVDEPAKPSSRRGPRYSTYGDLFFNPGKAQTFDAKPAPEPFPEPFPAPFQQDAGKQEAPLPAGVYRVGSGVAAPGVAQKKEPEYSEEARIAKLSGTVLLQLVVGEDGSARNINVVRGVGLGLEEKAVEAVGAWRFKAGTKDGAAVPVLANVEINFRLLEGTPPWRLTRAAFNPAAGVARPVLKAAPYPPDLGSGVSDSVRVAFDVDENGVPINFKSQSKGNPGLEAEAIAVVSGWRFQPGAKDGKPVITPATFDFNHAASESAGGAVNVPPEAAADNLIDKVVPQYPREAKEARIQGTVHLHVRIGTDGHVIEATLLSGHPLLTGAAIEAVRQWLYRPTLFNGKPVEVSTTVDVKFTLSQ